MDTPVYDFVRKYCGSKKTRFHMPGHKGSNVLLECEAMDITEIKGADVLSHAEGIIKKSQLNASALFKSGATFYSTEGSSHCIKTMLAVIIDDVKRDNREKRPYIIAARNVHRAMIDACALLDIDVEFILSEQSGNICENILDASVLDKKLNDCCDRGNMPACVYVTSPDYLGNIADNLSLLDIAEAIIVGDSTLLPSRVKLDEPSIKPSSQTIPFWSIWGKDDLSQNLSQAIGNMIKQSK